MTRSLRNAALWLVVIAMATGLAFFAVALALRQDETSSTTAAQLRDARQVAAYAADLRAMLDQIDAAGPGTESIALRLNDLRPKAREKQQQILRAHLAGPAYNALLVAADRLAALTASPRNAALYDDARNAQRDLEAQVRERLARLEAQSRRERNR
jgi:hypothetical protein